MHVTDIKAVRALAGGEWGREAKSIEARTKELADNKSETSTACLLELVKRANQAINAWMEDSRHEHHKISAPEKDDYVDADNAFPIGTKIYRADFDDGLSVAIVIGRSEKGHLLTTHADPAYTPSTFWERCKPHATIQEAVEEAAHSDIKYHKARFERAERLLALCKAGKLTTEENFNAYLPEIPDEE